MLNFRPLTKDDLPVVRPFLGDNPHNLCDLTVGGIFIWRDYFKTEFAIHNHILYFKVDYPEVGTVFTLPHGGDQNEEYRQVRQYCSRRGIPLVFYPIPKDELEPILSAFPGAQVSADRDNFDYLYRSEDLKYFRGKKLSGQRNHVNHFLRDHEDWSFQELTDADVDAALAFLEHYAAINQKDSGTFHEDMSKTRDMVGTYRQFGMVGGILRAEGQVVGLSIGEVAGKRCLSTLRRPIAAARARIRCWSASSPSGLLPREWSISIGRTTQEMRACAPQSSHISRWRYWRSTRYALWRPQDREDRMQTGRQPVVPPAHINDL